MKRIFKYLMLIILILAVVFGGLVGFLFLGWAPEPKERIWGVNFSQNQAELFGLDWKEAYLALLDDLKVKNLKLITYWDILENEKGKFYWADLDWQVREAEKRQAKIILVVGMKTGRWAECHLPQWAKKENKKEQQERILKLIQEIVLRYKDSSSILAWQVENEPLFLFGECPWKDKKFLAKEVELVKSLDSRPIVVSDSGEFSSWFEVAKLGDIVGITMYKRTWFKELKNYITYPFPPVYYWRRAQLINKFFKKEVICVELQAEPWGPGKIVSDTVFEEQQRTMDLKQFQKNIAFAKKTGLKSFYFWGAEWWYWLKEKQGRSEIWEEARKLFVPNL